MKVTTSWTNCQEQKAKLISIFTLIMWLGLKSVSNKGGQWMCDGWCYCARRKIREQQD